MKLVPQHDTPGPSDRAGEARCAKQTTLGFAVCAESRGALLNAFLGAVVLSGLLARTVVLAALRALRYRKDLTRLSAQIATQRR